MSRQRQQLEQRLRELERKIELTQAECDQYRGRVSAIESSKFWKLRSSWLRLKNRLLGAQEPLAWKPELPNLPPLEPLPEPPAYEQWRQHHTPRPADWARMRETVSIFSYQPLISVIAAVDHASEADLTAAIDSVIAQIYPHWQLCLAVPASITSPALLQAYAEQNSQINLIFQPEAEKATALNAALALASGDYVALLNPQRSARS